MVTVPVSPSEILTLVIETEGIVRETAACSELPLPPQALSSRLKEEINAKHLRMRLHPHKRLFQICIGLVIFLKWLESYCFG